MLRVPKESLLPVCVFKAWALSNTLHPNLPINPSLVFDIIDSHHQRSIGGCRYFVKDPGGRSDDKYPTNASEAETRLLTKFQTHGHTPGTATVTLPIENPEYPYTLDLRMHSSAQRSIVEESSVDIEQNESIFTYPLL